MRWSYIIGIAIGGFLFLPAIIDLYTEYLWFSQVGYASVFLTVLKSRIGLAIAGAVFFFAMVLLNVRQAIKNAIGEEAGVTPITLLLLLLFGLFMGGVASVGWELMLRYLNAVPFNEMDPVFGNDIGFYFFSLPFYLYVKNLLFFGFILVSILTFGFYLIFSGAIVRDEYGRFGLEFPRFNKASLSHLYFLAGIIFLLLSIGYVLDRYSILYSTRGVVFGAGYTDAKIQLPLITSTAVISFLTALAFFASARLRDIRPPVVGIALLIIVSILGNTLAGLVQQYKVAPDEFNLERPYLLRNIEATRAAYDLEEMKEVEFPAGYELTFEDIERNNQTIDNIRLWDWRPLMRTYKQVQLIRTYYDFGDVDIDRYIINGDYKQVMLSAREINSELLPEKTWLNRHLVFTHGYGVAMSPVREVSQEGLPVLYVRDIPPESAFFNITRPEIYYGELAKDYVIVRTTTKEFDYPKGESPVYTFYEGEGGIQLNSIFRKAAMAMRFNTLKILVSDSIKKESRIMFYRDIKERARVIAPFLIYDRDPYIVVSNGSLYWIIDAYTISDRYPYSEPEGDLNYIRNSVKVTIDAYDGEVAFYVIEEEPVIKTYMGIFPALFRPFSEMPEELKRHIRYPADLFSIQASKYATYHMRNPRVFYNREDKWEIPEEVYEAGRIPMEPYYLITKLPGEEKEEFIIITPFTPKEKKNMIAWLAARGDLPRYGEKIVYMFPKGEWISGPLQIEARIDQDPDISQLFTLWKGGGSEVIRGNLLVIPIEDSLLYVEPVYLRAEQEEAIPELKRVIVAFGDKLTMQETLEESLAVIFGKAPPPAVEVLVERTPSQLIDKALSHYEKAQQYLREGDWAGYGEELAKLEEVLRELKEKSK
jgi:hypothetical protein